ncbi:MAG: AI-2E family transporter, partial [Chloroflexi bacterium]|nr:AI-2E family transporter [Chloroflexota bacterium]
LLAVIAGILEMVPVVGPLMAAVVAVSVSAFKSPLLALIVALFYLLVQQLENNLLVPKIMGHAVGISPLTVITALAVGGSLAGVFGAILAVPVAAALQVLIGAVLRGDVDPRVEENGRVSVTVRDQPVTE